MSNKSLKREDTRLRDWNLYSLPTERVTDRAWKEKILDYEIETFRRNLNAMPSSTWKEKILDYEIETMVSIIASLRASATWKEKILDYEIETRKWVPCPLLSIYQWLEKRRYSITRLKPQTPVWAYRHRQAWKEKILDYEIETWEPTCCSNRIGCPWKEKILDYEIETINQFRKALAVDHWLK